MKSTIRIGHLGLLESAPLLAAQAGGYFASEGLAVELSCELGVAALCGRLSDQRIDGACLPAQMPVLLSLGAGVSRVPMTPILLTSTQDLAIVLNTKAAAPEKQPRGTTGVLKIGVLGHSSPACHLVRRWLQSEATGVKEDPVYVSLAASQLLHFFEEGLIDGFCGLDPLPALAGLSADGVVVRSSGAISPAHPGGVVALRTEFSKDRPDIAAPLARALRRGVEFCANPANNETVWSFVLAQNPFVLTSEEHRSALLAQSFGGPSASMSIRFESSTGPIGVDAQGARFIEQACRASLGAGERTLDIAGEIDRLYLKAA
jgi:ABC-type nitrate/sulfonate/bicarbonate transport system substrate-binding protein